MNHLNDPFTRSVYSNLKYKYPNSSLNFAILKLSINGDELKKIYTKRIGDHNKNFLSNLFPDAGFDVLVPTQTIFDTEIDTKFIDMSIKTEMLYCDVERDIVSSSGFVVHPRSSISKTPLMLANHTGVIDSGYRGSLIGAFRLLVSSLNEESEYVVEQYTRLLQICHPILCPIFVVIVDENNLTSTERGDGGFGSTGK